MCGSNPELDRGMWKPRTAQKTSPTSCRSLAGSTTEKECHPALASILECSQCSTRGSHYSYCFPQMLHDDAHHSIGETTGVGAQAPGSGSERTAAFSGFLEAQQALGDGGHAGLTSLGQVSEAEINTRMLHGYTVELLRRPSGHILTLSNERVAKRFCLATMQHFGEAHQWTDAQPFSG